MTIPRSRSRSLGLAALLLGLWSTPAWAADLAVDDTADSVDAAPGDGSCADAGGACTLRAAIQEANALPGPDSIAVPAGLYLLSIAGQGEDAAATGDLDITDDLSLSGAGPAGTVLDGGGLDRVLQVPDPGARVWISSLAIQNGSLPFEDGSFPDDTGGGLRNDGTLTLERVHVRDSSALLGGAMTNFGTLSVLRSRISGNEAWTVGNVLGAGGIGNAGTLFVEDTTISGNHVFGTGGGIGSFGPVTVVRSTISGNHAVQNGGGVASASGTLSVVNSTISGNTTDENGGGISFVGEVVLLDNVTITANVADFDGDGSGDGGGLRASGLATVANSIVAGNLDGGGEAPDCTGGLVSEGHNLIGDASSCNIAGDTTGNITGADPLLGPLADHGGPTQTHAPLPGSPVIDAGSPAAPGAAGACEASDQRLAPRPEDGDGDGEARCDIGAFEVEGPPEPGEFSVSFQVVNRNGSGLACPADGLTYTVHGHLRGPAPALEGPAPRVATLYLGGFETGEWNWRFRAVEGYDWPAELEALGHVSVTIDMLGYDASGHPVGFFSCVGSQADVADQIVQQLRSGSYHLEGGDPVTFQEVVLAGADIGGAVAEVAAYSFQNLDGLVVMGWSDQGGSPYILQRFAEANLRCATGGQEAEPGGPPGYFHLPTEEDWRGRDGSGDEAGLLFFDADPEVVEKTFALRNPNPCGHLPEILAMQRLNQQRLREVTVPVLLLYSAEDPVFPPEGQQQQPAHFQGSSSVTLEVQPDSAHFPMFELNAGEYRLRVSNWLCEHDLVSAGVADTACSPEEPDGGAKATGGGWLETQEGRKLNFGFNAKQQADGPDGELQLNDKAAGVKIHLSELSALGGVDGPCGSVDPGPRSLELRGHGRFNGVDGAEFRVCVKDEPDLLYLECLSGCAYDTASRTPDDALDGGNIQVRGAADPPQPSGGEATVLVLDPVLLSEAPAGGPQLLTVSAYGADGEPLPGAPVSLEATGPGGQALAAQGFTGPLGTALFTLDVVQGESECVVRAGELESNRLEVTGTSP